MSATTADQTSGIEAVQEIRFAVVMYGGVSLAIYINGVAQELRRLVYATSGARDGVPPDLKPNSTHVVYRKLAQMLSGAQAVMPSDVPDEAPIRTRFVVDILSGTSAGGINAIYLAKSLVNDCSIDGLKKLWIHEGDLGRLLNDELGAGRAAGTPASLLDGGYMYRQLLAALDGMDPTRAELAAGPSPNVRELARISHHMY